MLVLIDCRSHSRYQSPRASFSCLVTNNQTAGVSWGVTGRHSDPCLEPVLTTGLAPAQVRHNPEFLCARGYRIVLVPFFKESNSGEVSVAVKPGLLLPGAATPVDSSPFPPFASHGRTLGYFYVPCDGRGTRAVSSQETSITPLHVFVFGIFCLESRPESFWVSSMCRVCWVLSGAWVGPMGVTAVPIIH